MQRRIRNIGPAAIGWLLIGIHCGIFSQFFPNAQGKLGHDFQYNLPLLLDGYYWFLNNGLWSLPWFTPSFCGGMPLIANPATFYVSTTQWFTFLTDPLTAVRLTFLLFATLGFWGFYLLLSRVFAAGRWTALLGGGLFLFNGLYAWRMVVGHMEFHAFMLTPLIAFFLLRGSVVQSAICRSDCIDKNPLPLGGGGWRETGGDSAGSTSPTPQPPPAPLKGVLNRIRGGGESGTSVTGQRWLAGETGSVGQRRWRVGRDVVCVGVMLGYAFMSGMTQLIVPSLIAVAVIALTARLTPGVSVDLRGAFCRLTGAGLFALGLSASKLVAALSFLGNFPRDSYLLPGVDGLAKLVFLIGEVLTVGGAHVAVESTIANSQWTLGRHEFEFGLSLVPVALIGAGLVLNGGWRRTLVALSPLRQLPFVFGCLLLLAIPLALNYYSPAWNEFLKTVPFLKNLSNFFRWFIIYMPWLILLSALALEKTPTLARMCRAVVGGSLVWVVAQNLFTDSGYYHDQPYDPAPVVNAYRQTRANGQSPVIVSQVASLDEEGRPALTLARNDALIEGGSQILCYEPMFGFRLEFLPFKGIRPGPSLSEHDGALNVKNPACYLYPAENNCSPGDHFRPEQLTEARQFISFHPFNYRMSRWQTLADRVNRVCLLAVPLFALGYGVAALRRRGDWQGAGR